MKHIMTALVLLTTVSYSSQTQIFPLNAQNSSNFTEGIYLKDTQGLLTFYIGTWRD